jgi:hypothetical protein
MKAKVLLFAAWLATGVNLSAQSPVPPTPDQTFSERMNMIFANY